MNSEETALAKRLAELALRAERSRCYTNSDFLTLAEQDILAICMDKLPDIPWTAEGGAEGCERRMAFFGSAELCGYEQMPPIACVKVSPRSSRFADSLSHRDFLGALMSLGVRREKLGDIFIKENIGYVFCDEQLAGYLADSLISVKRTAVSCGVLSDPPPELAVTKVSMSVNTPSERIDAVLAAVWGLSRGQSAALFAAKRVFVNSKEKDNSSYLLKPGDVVSARGVGKFIYMGEERSTKKNRLFVKIEKLV